MKKKLLSVCLAAVIAALAIGGASLAYLQDDDSARNVMAIGSLSITQNEKEADGSDFVQNKPMLPAVFTEEITDDNLIVDGMFNGAIKNVVDKLVSVTNHGNQTAYIRTIILFEGTYAQHKQLVYVNGTYDYAKDADDNVLEVTLNGTTYCVAVCTYADPVAADATTSTSLRQLFFAPQATGTDMTQFGTSYDVLCVSQAVQVAGFETLGAESALNTAFGHVDATNVTTWFAEIAA